MATPILNVIGTGKLGTVLARLLADRGEVAIGSLFSRSPEKAREAAAWIGAGEAIHRLDATRPAPLWLLSVSDDAIAPVATTLARLPLDWNIATVFHCSGLHSAELLAPQAALGAETASVHPVHSFADRTRSLAGFAGTSCTGEGSDDAIRALEPLFSAIGARLVAIEAARKPLYHAATAMASNHLVALLGAAANLMQRAGIDAAAGRDILRPLALQSAENVFTAGATCALTGPVARGDAGTVEKHLAALAAHSPELLPTYLALSRLALDLATAGETTPGHRQIRALLEDYGEQR